ncbi:MBL fold metallo-hydrolase [Streptomyces sp. RLA2-12]|uniref:MBL fold metallo-hydrolase n=1 Tax=Streptomyces sp. RLA2-12 TaxID=2721242 RepID=UPI00145F9FC1|nr:MBL fold metallo-hydrolase [Streptomyces sp. RLA2-12]NMI55823.1 MBL fold metallo-hydrolase [Streptomyces sp. RLA2-12]
MSTPLEYAVYITDPIEQTAPPLPNGETPRWSPLSTTLVYSEKHAVLVDPPFTIAETDAVGDWVESYGRTLTHIFITHGHGDHWFGAPRLAQRFGATIVAAAGTATAMEASRAGLAWWEASFPGQIPDTKLEVSTPGDGLIPLEGHEVRIVEAGHGDTDHSAVLHVPAIGLVVAGDVIYDGYHQMLREAQGDGVERWIEAIDKVAELKPSLIVAGHKRKERDNDANRQIADTKAYLVAAREVIDSGSDLQQFYAGLTGRFPERLNPNAVYIGGLGLFG